MEKFEPKENTLKDELNHHVRNMVLGIDALVKCMIGEEGYPAESIKEIKKDINNHIVHIEKTYPKLSPENVDKMKHFLEVVAVPEKPDRSHIETTYKAFGEIEDFLNSL
jgi:hypothetical protein